VPFFIFSISFLINSFPLVSGFSPISKTILFAWILLLSSGPTGISKGLVIFEDHFLI
jgi:hypothetical protein